METARSRTLGLNAKKGRIRIPKLQLGSRNEHGCESVLARKLPNLLQELMARFGSQSARPKLDSGT